MKRKVIGLILGLAFIFASAAVATLSAAQPFFLAYPGTNGIVDFSRYGKFYGIGTANYKYVITDPAGLARELGEGIYPNTNGVLQDPAYLNVRNQLDIPKENYGLWAGDSNKPQINFFRWITSDQDPASKLFFAAQSFKDAQMWMQALKAYYALLIEFPTASRKNSADSWSWSASLGEMAKDSILFIVRNHPELGLDFKDADIEIENIGEDGEKVIKIHPGYFVRASNQPPPPLTDIIQVRGTGKVKLIEYKNHHWIMAIDGRPFFMKGVCYDVTKVGQSPDLGTQVNFTDLDDPPGVFDSWVDKNKNNIQDADEPVIGDQKLLQYMGCNIVRVYFGAKSKTTLARFYNEAGIRTAMGVAFGAYAVDSGSTWEKGTDYTDLKQRAHMLQVLKDTVMKYKDEPYIVCWILGNENNFGVHNNANLYPAAYCDLVEQACKMVHKLDPNHPVAACIGEVGFLDKLAQFAPDLDMIAMNAYRGNEGFGDMWETVQKKTDLPVFLSEFGCPAYKNGMGEDEEGQANYLSNEWRDIDYNRGGGRGVGNSLGGMVFEWQDEWWKAGGWKSPSVHDTSKGQWQGPFPDGNSHEEWFGLTSQGDGKNSPQMRQLRKSYWDLRALWTSKP